METFESPCSHTARLPKSRCAVDFDLKQARGDNGEERLPEFS